MATIIDSIDLIALLPTDDWKADEYRWFQNGIKKIPAANPGFRKCIM